jgi:hypothetical protein
MHCPGCGANNDKDARFCAECGQKLEFGIGNLAGEEPGSSLPQFERLRKRGPGKGMSVASLLLGICAILPFGWFVGIPAIVLGTLAIVKKRPGRSMAITGLVMGAAAPVFSTIVFFAVLPGFVHGQERAREAEVKNAMLVIQAAFDSFAADRGSYPEERDLSFAGGRAYSYLPGGDPVGAGNAGEPVPGPLPTNPYSRTAYSYGEDLFYFPAQLDSGMNAVLSEDDDLCPYAGYEAPQGKPGTIVVFGYSDMTTREPFVTEYGVFGYGRDTDNPLTVTGTDGEERYCVFFSSLSEEELTPGEPEETDTLPE